MLVPPQFSSKEDAMSRWGDEKTIHFIRLYRQRECLWNTRSQLYKNNFARDRAYRSILKVFNDNNMDIKSVKTKIKNLRSVYHTELKKMRDISRCGSDGQVYRPSLAWFDEMHAFLGDAIEERAEPTVECLAVDMEAQGSSAEENEGIDKDKSLKSEHNIQNEGILEPYLDPIEDNQSDASINDTNVFPSSNPPQSSSGRQIRTPNRIVKKRTHDSVSKAVQRIENTLSNVLNKTQERQNVLSQNEDEFHMFALSVAAQLRHLPLHLAVTTQSKIQSLLSEARLASIFTNSLTQPSLDIVKREDASDE